MGTRRKPIRLPHYDYAAAGAYFITVCVEDRRNLLGKVQDADTLLSPAGDVVLQTWLDLPKHYSFVELDEFVVMPNHIHGLIWLQDIKVNSDAVGAGFKPAPTRHGLSELVRGLKTFSARRINELLKLNPKFAWQRGFYEHIIRDEADLFYHRQYIRENPAKWESDEYRV